MKRLMTVLFVLLTVPALLGAQAPAAGQPPAAPPKAAAPAPATGPAPAATTPAAPAAPRPAATNAPAGPSKVAVIDMRRAVTENTEGKKAAEKFVAEMTKRQTDLQGKQKAIQDLQNKLQTQDKALSDAAKAELSRDIERRTTDLNRAQEDAQKELDDIQNVSLRPIAERVNTILGAYASENGFTVVFDVGQSGIIFASDVSDITTEIIRRFDAEAAKAAPKTPGKQ